MDWVVGGGSLRKFGIATVLSRIGNQGRRDRLPYLRAEWKAWLRLDNTFVTYPVSPVSFLPPSSAGKEAQTVRVIQWWGWARPNWQ